MAQEQNNSRVTLKDLSQRARDRGPVHREFLKKLKQKPPKDLDRRMQELHQGEFAQTDCLSCANCCKTTGPLFTNVDIERISRYLKLKPGKFQEEYLRLDEDGDLVLKSVPCTFLADDNSCLIYQVRPKACREFPHTDRKKFHQIADLTLKNVGICPAAFNIVERMLGK